jgi:hypothetical protein
MKTLTAIALGGALVYFLDPVSGGARRARARRSIDGLLQMSRRAAVETGRHDVADALGKVQRVAQPETEGRIIVPASSS